MKRNPKQSVDLTLLLVDCVLMKCENEVKGHACDRNAVYRAHSRTSSTKLVVCESCVCEFRGFYIEPLTSSSSPKDSTTKEK